MKRTKVSFLLTLGFPLVTLFARDTQTQDARHTLSLQHYEQKQIQLQKELQNNNVTIQKIDDEIGQDKVSTEDQEKPNKWSTTKKIGKVLCIAGIGVVAGGGTSILAYKAVGTVLAKMCTSTLMVGIFGGTGGGAMGTLNAIRSIKNTGDVQLRESALKTVADSSLVGTAVGAVGALVVPLGGVEEPVGQIVVQTMNVYYLAENKNTLIDQPEGL